MMRGEDFYNVMCAMVPLYFAMLIAYGSVKWWKIFTAQQCSGINRFVAVFAVPILSFHFISQNNPYQMETKLIIADTLSKLFVLLLLSLWTVFFTAASLDWLITLFSVCTLPNTLVMGIPLLKAMYGDFTQSLMVQLVVLQCIIWYTLLLFLFEYRAAMLLIKTRFPGPTAGSITKIDIDGDIISLDGRDPLLTESETDNNGRIRVRIRRSTSSADQAVGTESSSIGIVTPARASNISSAEIFSVNTPVTQLHDLHCWGSHNDGGYRSTSPKLSGYASSDAYSLQPTPRASNFNELEIIPAASTTASTPVWIRSPVSGNVFRQASPAFSGVRMVWESPAGKWQSGGGGVGGAVGEGFKPAGMELKEISFRESSNIAGDHQYDEDNHSSCTQKVQGASRQLLPNALVMLRLILVVVGRKLARNPNTYSSVLGLLWSLISFKWNLEMPSLMKSSIKIISDAGLGMAMFSLGLFMALQPRIIACGPKRAGMGMVIRFISGPIIMSAASISVGLRGVKLHAAIVQAALPQGIVPFVFAREYGLHPDILSTGVIFGMLVSLPVTLLYYIFLGL